MNYRLLNCDVLDGLAQLPDESVQCVVTSPPYWGLRDYGVAGQLGLERTPDEYVSRMVAVFAEVRRVLRSDGTLWLNIGDSYSGSGKGGDPPESPFQKQATNAGSLLVAQTASDAAVTNVSRRLTAELGMKPKDLIGIPWRLAFGLQSDGWYLRSDIIWSKPNPMPESVTDRPTKAHEYLFLLTKSAKYFYDHEAIKEPAEGWKGSRFDDGKNAVIHPNVGRNRDLGAKGQATDVGENRAGAGARMGRGAGWRNDPANTPETRNKRSVWIIATEPFPEAHFATFPTALVEPCILAGSRVGDTILDPFNGSGTTGVVALGHQRDYIGIELNASYVDMARRRLQGVAPMFATEIA